MEIENLEVKTPECPVCHEYYKKPKILPCAHLTCRDCLVSWIKTNKNTQCPLCPCAIVDPQNHDVKTCEDGIDQLPTDEVMSEIVDNMRILNQKRVCYVHKKLKAKSFCQHCEMMLCSTCEEAHTTIPATSFHKLEELEKLTLESLTSCRQPPCLTHPQEASKHYCAKHDAYICNECALFKHRDCPEVSGINDVFERNKRSLSEIVDRLDAIDSALSQVMAEIEKRVVIIKQNIMESLNEIDEACDRLVLSIENCRKRLKKLVQDKNDKLMAGTYKQKDELCIKHGLVASHRSLINRMQLSASCTSMVSMIPQLNKLVSGLDLSTPLLSDWKSLTTAKVIFDEKALSRIELELERLGQLNKKVPLAEEQAGWGFHPNHGKHIVLTNNSMTAESKMPDHGLVFSSEPVEMNLLYEVQVQETYKQFDGNHVGFGLVTEDPGVITCLSQNSIELQSAIGVFGGSIFVKKHCSPHKVGIAYKTFKVGSRIGVLVDAARCLHIYVDGKDQGVVFRDVHLPCWAMFDFSCFLKKVTVLPLASYL